MEKPPSTNNRVAAILESNIALFFEIKGLFERAEKSLKQVELATGALDIPAVNELRYLGKHLLRALDSDDGDYQKKNLYSAKRHIERAIFDIYDYGIAFYLDKIRLFQNDYRLVVITTDIIPDYVYMQKEIQDIQDFVADMDRDDDDSRGGYALQAGENYGKIRKHSRILEAARQELNKKRDQVFADHSLMEEERSNRNVTRRIITIQAVVAVIALLFASATGFYFGRNDVVQEPTIEQTATNPAIEQTPEEAP